MPGTETITRSETRERELSQLEAQRPELSAWLRPLRISLASLEDGTWKGAIPVCSQMRAPDAPVLDDAAVAVEPARVRSHVRAVLLAALGPRDFESASTMDELALLELAISGDEAAMVSPALGAAMHLAALPLLITCAQHTPPPPQWAHGYCPVCGAPPVFSEVLGLERSRHLRCGRCCAAWKTNVLVCPFCSETDHAQLGSLVPDGPQGQICWVETCNTCRGYLKARAALRSMNAENVLIEDARTIDLDFVAAERGYVRTAGSGHPVRLRITPDAVS